MSWLSSIGDSIGSVFGSSDAGSSIANALPSDTNFYSSLLNSGIGLAGTYFQQSQNKSLAEEAYKQRMAEIAAQNAAGGSSAGAAMKMARMKTLADLYSQQAALAQKAGDSEMQGGQNIGALGQAPIIARLGALR